MSLAAFGDWGSQLLASPRFHALPIKVMLRLESLFRFPVGPEHLDNTIETDHLSLSSVRACGRNSDRSLAFPPALAHCAVGRRESSTVLFF